MSKLGYPEDVISQIFGESSVKNMVELIFDRAEEPMKKRFDEIKAFIVRKENDVYSKIQFDEIKVLFKQNFLEEVLEEALKTKSENYENVSVKVLKLLNDERINKSIFGQTMVSAFQEKISNLPADRGFTKTMHGSTIYLLEKKFITA